MRGSTALSVLAVTLVSCSGAGGRPTQVAVGAPTTVPTTAPQTAPPTTAPAALPTAPSATAAANTQRISAVPATADAAAAANPFGSPEALAAAITRAERGVRDRDLAADEVARLGRFQQRAYRALAETPEWDAAVRALLPDEVRAAFDRNVEARRAVVAHSAAQPPREPPTTLPAWRVVEPEPLDTLERHYREAEATSGVPWAYLAAIHLVETRMGRVVGTSSAGAVGPMQFLPSTWEACCRAIGDPLVTRDAILGAGAYLSQHGAPDDMLGALRVYNPNEGYVGAVDAYARNLLADPAALRGYHAWEVYVTTLAGTVRLPVGFAADEPVDAAAYLASHPEDRAPVDD